MKIELFTSKECINCRKIKKMLPNLLSELGLKYEDVIVERDVQNSDALADLLMLDTDNVPALCAGKSFLIGEAVVDATELKKFLVANL